MEHVGVVVVQVGDRRVGLPAAGVAEVHPIVEATALPNAPDVVDGVVNVRGSLVPILDLRARFGLARRAPQLTDHLVVARIGSRLMALRVDRAVDLVAIPAEALQSGRALPGGEALIGVATLPDGLLLIHDLDAFLSRTEAAELDRVLSEALEA